MIYFINQKSKPEKNLIIPTAYFIYTHLTVAVRVDINNTGSNSFNKYVEFYFLNLKSVTSILATLSHTICELS